MNSHVLALMPLICVWVVGGTALAIIDIRTHRLPNPIVLGMYPCVPISVWIAGLLTGESEWGQAMIGAAIWLVALGAVWLGTAGAGMGFGDVKLAPLLGFSLGWFGWELASFGLICAWCIAGIYAGLLILSRRVNRSTTIAFGPFLLVGFWLAMVFGPGVVRGGSPWLWV